MADVRTSQSAPGAVDPGAGGSQHQAEGLVDAVGQEVRDAAEDLKREASDAAAQAKQQARQMAARQKQVAAGQLSDFAQALKGASGDLENRGQPFAARCVGQAADGLERASDALERRDFDDLIAGVEDFARRQPVAFLGGAMLAGFGLARLMKSSAERPRGTGHAGAFQAHGSTLSGAAFPGHGTGSAEAMRSRGPTMPETSRPGSATTPGFGPGRDTRGEEK